MSKELKNIKKDIMSQIESGKLKMRPKLYFVIGSVLTFVGLVISVVTSVFIFSLMRFSLRSHGSMGEYRLGQLISDFPWWLSMLAILGLIVGMWLLRRYDFSYKINLKMAIIIFIVAIIMSGWLADMVGLNDALIHRGSGSVRGVMKEYFQKQKIQSSTINSFPRHKKGILV